MEISLYNVKGQIVEVLFEGNQIKGAHNLVWNAKTEASGIYFVRLRTESFTQLRKVVLLK